MTTDEQKQQLTSTNVAGVHVIGTNLVPPKLLSILEKAFENAEHGLWTLVFSQVMSRGNDGEEQFSAYYQVGHTAEVNLMFHFADAAEAICKDECDMSIEAYIWYNLLISCLHELRHSYMNVIEGINIVNLSLEAQKELCDSCQEWAKTKVLQMAKFIDIEPPEDLGMIIQPSIAEFKQELLALEPADTQPWIAKHKQMAETGAIYIGADYTFNTFREYCRFQMNDGDEAWTVDIETAVANATEAAGPPTDSPAPPVTTDTQDSGYAPGDEDLAAMGDETVYPEPEDGNPSGPSGPSSPTYAGGPEVHAPEYDAQTNWDEPLSVPQSSNAQPANIPNLAMPAIEECVYRVFMRLAGHMLRKCLYQPQGGTFANPHGVMDGVFIGDIPNAQAIFHSMDCIGADGQMISNVKIFEVDSRLPNRPVGWVQGRIFTPNLPGYWLHLNVNGQLHKRTIIPQNALKNPTTSKWAQQMASGRFIVLVYRDLTEQEQAMNNAAVAMNQKKPINGIKFKIEVAPGTRPVYTVDPFGNSRTLNYPPLG
jgi:hypothetical protein